MSSHPFHPSLGGLEMVSGLLARALTRLGQEVILITQTPDAGSEHAFEFEVVRQPSARRLMQLTRWSDLVFHNNISLRVAWPLLLIRRPWTVAHHIWLPRGRGSLGIAASLKRAALRHAQGIAISDAIAADFVTPCTVIPNPYDDETFREIPTTRQRADLVFVGRFVSGKGLPILLKALSRLASTGMTPSLTVIGKGPEETTWRRLTTDLGLSGQVHFAGVMRGADLAAELNAHRVMVIPSHCNEAFGVVALEGIACGCIVIGSDDGGLKQAIGSAGLTFKNSDDAELASAIARALSDSDIFAPCRAAAPEHLARHTPDTVARQYLDVFQLAVA